MKRTSALILLGIILGTSIAAVVWGYGWYLGQIIYQHTFSSKAGVDYWATWTLGNRLFTASALLTLLSMITLPQRSTFVSFITAISQMGGTVKRLDWPSAVAWRALEACGFFVYYVSTGGYSLTGQNVAFLMMMLDLGAISVSADDVATLFALPFAPGTSAESIQSLVPAMEAYQLYMGLFATFLAVTVGRIVLNIATDLLAQKRDILEILSKVLLAGALVVAIEIMGVPLWTVNAGTWMTYLACIIAMGSCIVGSLALFAFRVHSGDVRTRIRGKIAQLEEDLARLQGELLSVRQEYEGGAVGAEDYRRRVNMLMEDRSSIAGELRRLKIERLIPIGGSPRRFGLLAVVLIAVVVMLPATQAFYYGIQMDGNKYIEWKFNLETQKEIQLTSWAAGTQGMSTMTLHDLTLNATPESELEFLTTVRQWDQDASFLRMKNQIGANWMQLADSDIVFLREHEYWFAPLTLDYDTVSTNFINQHLIYTHTEGLVVLDAYSGNIIEGENLVTLLNRSEGVGTYYGEGTGFEGNVFVNVPGFDEVGNISYQGQPDYTLRGFESWFYMLTMGPQAWSFLGRDLNMLVERSVLSRVSRILLQGLVADTDSYIVVDPVGTVYYAVSVYADYRLATSYAHENYMRFMGVVLVDVGTGVMGFYRSPTVDTTFFIDKLFSEYYPWQETPSWLQSQMKWPEDLYERQLSVAYTYHVTNGFIWRSGIDFHSAPGEYDTRYIIMRIGGVDRFVATHNVEFLNSPGKNLAGLYVMGCGNRNFGQLTFYGSGSIGSSTLIGPEAARQAFLTSDNVRTQLTLWGNFRYGNILLYHLGGEVLFVIPVFLQVETSESRVIEKLGGVGLVDAETGSHVVLGSNVVEAYSLMFGLLNKTTILPGAVGLESAVFSPATVQSGARSGLVALMRNNDNVSHSLYLDIAVKAGNFSVQWHGTEVTPTLYPTNTTFTLDIGVIGPTDLYGTSPTVTVYLPSGIVSATYLVTLVLRTEEGVVDQLSLFITVVV